MRRLVARLAVVIASLVLAGCATLSRVEHIAPPAALLSFFDTCAAGDGGLYLEVWEDDALAYSSEIDWIARPQGGWSAQVGTSLTGGFARLDASGRSIAWTQAPAGMPVVGADARGWLEVGGYLTGLRVDEVPCLLKGAFPRRWAKSSRWIQRGDILENEVSTGDRRVRVVAESIGGRSPRVCATLDWPMSEWGVLGWIARRGATICVNQQPDRSSRETVLTGVGDWRVRWVPMEGDS